MASEKKDPTIVAVEAVHAALKPLTAEERQRVLASVHALLNITPLTVEVPSAQASAQQKQVAAASSLPTAPSRPVAIRELVQDKHPRTHPQFITLFAYYREKYQSFPTFSRDQLEEYYTSARQKPPTNYDRDFVEAIKRGWIHEDGENSYITSKGIEAVESGFTEDAKRSKAGHSKKKPKSSRSAKRA